MLCAAAAGSLLPTTGGTDELELNLNLHWAVGFIAEDCLYSRLLKGSKACFCILVFLEGRYECTLFICLFRSSDVKEHSYCLGRHFILINLIEAFLQDIFLLTPKFHSNHHSSGHNEHYLRVCTCRLLLLLYASISNFNIIALDISFWFFFLLFH